MESEPEKTKPLCLSDSVDEVFTQPTIPEPPKTLCNPSSDSETTPKPVFTTLNPPNMDNLLLPSWTSSHHKDLSTSSCDSILTQVPGPYHLKDSPMLRGETGGFENFAGASNCRRSSTPLNPNSAPYVPPSATSSSYGSQAYDPQTSFALPPTDAQPSYYGQQIGGQQGQIGHQQGQIGHQGQGGQLSQYQPQTQGYGGAPVTTFQGTYVPVDFDQGFSSHQQQNQQGYVGAATQYQRPLIPQAPNLNPAALGYEQTSQYAQVQRANVPQAPNLNPNALGYESTSQGYGQDSYQPQGSASQLYNQNNMAQPVYQQPNSYSARPSVAHQTQVMTQNQPLGHTYTGICTNQYTNQSAQYGGPPSQPGYTLQANVNRGKFAPVSYKDTATPRTNVQQKNSSNYHPYHNVAGPSGTQAYSTAGGEHKYGGAVMAPPANMSGYAGPPMSEQSFGSSYAGNSSEYSNSTMLMSQTPSQVPSEDGNRSRSDVGSPTPLPRANDRGSQAGMMNNTETPGLRVPRRAPDNLVPSSAPPARNNTGHWLANNNGPPPKMMSLLSNNLTPSEQNRSGIIAEPDPFVQATPTRAAVVHRAAPPSIPRSITLPALPALPAPIQSNALVLANHYPPTGNVFVNNLPPIKGNENTHLPSQQIWRLFEGGLPNQQGKIYPLVDAALSLNNLPFWETCRHAQIDEWGVVRLRNIPYNVSRGEVLAYLGRNARILNETDHEPIHIIMERVTSKTLDCFIEFSNFGDAVAAVQRFEQNRINGKGGRLGQRHCDMELSSQADLMKELFPKAKNVTWHGAKPVIAPTDPADPYNSGFQGFLIREELINLVKHVEYPSRSPFSKDCPQRPYECLISTLLKYPWHMVDHVTIKDRAMLHQATLDMLDALRDFLDRRGEGRLDHRQTNHTDVHLNDGLFRRIWKAGLKCQGFSPYQKASIAALANIPIIEEQEWGLPMWAGEWGKVFTLSVKPETCHDIWLYYAALIREHTDPKNKNISLAEKAEMGGKESREWLFGNMNKISFPDVKVGEIDDMTLAQVARCEWTGMEKCIRDALEAQHGWRRALPSSTRT